MLNWMMNCWRMRRVNKGEAGAALLIAIFALLLISVIAIALVVSSGADTALKDNYRTSTGAYYAALAGVEEARGRLLWKNPDAINLAIPGYFPDPTNPTMPLNNALYILNDPAANPTDLGNNLAYPDKEFETEFGIPVTSATVRTINSVSGAGGVPGPLFKWVRITAATVHSFGVDIAGDGNTNDATGLLFYEPVARGALRPGLVKIPPTPLQATQRQVLEITALAAVPPNTQKLLQYIVSPISYGLNFHAPLVIPGSVLLSPTVTFHGATSGAFHVNGTDGSGIPPTIPGCLLSEPMKPAVGVSDIGGPANVTAVVGGIPATPAPGMSVNYEGSGGTPSVQDIFVNASMQAPASLNDMVRKISQYADGNIHLNATEAELAAITNAAGAMSPTNPMAIVVDGALTIGSDFTGYGLLVVTGDLTANADFGWKGVVLVVGSGNVMLRGGPGGSSEFDGAMLVANTMDYSTVPANARAALGPVNFDATDARGRGIYYNSCWVDLALNPPTFQIHSFREIVSPN
jgi:hypothetical protein